MPNVALDVHVLGLLLKESKQKIFRHLTCIYLYIRMYHMYEILFRKENPLKHLTLKC